MWEHSAPRPAFSVNKKPPYFGDIFSDFSILGGPKKRGKIPRTYVPLCIPYPILLIHKITISSMNLIPLQ